MPDLLAFSSPVEYRETHGGHYRVAPHLHDGCEVFFVLNPTLSYFVEDHLYAAKAGDLLVTRADEIHHPIVADPERYSRAFVQFRPETLREHEGAEPLLRAFFDRAKGRGNLYSPGPAEQKELLRIRERMRCAEEASDGFTTVQLLSALVDLLRVIRRMREAAATDAGGRSGAVRPAGAAAVGILNPVRPTDAVSELIAWIDGNLTSDLSLDALAERVYLDKSTLCRRFRRELGITVQDFVRNKRILAAREKLLEGATVSEACEASGFRDYANFIRTFTKIAGISPGKYGKRRTD